MQKPGLILGIAGVAVIAVVAMVFAFKGASTSEIRDLAKSGSDESAMIAAVEKSSQPYKLSAEDIISLKKDGVPDAVVVKMIEHKP